MTQEVKKKAPVKKVTKICLGDKVLLDDKKSGWVRYMGPLPKKKLTQYGIELEEAGTGTTGGTFNKKKYFKCKSKTGVFVTKSKIQKCQKSDKSSGPRVTIGTKVTVSMMGKGTVRYVGKTDINDNISYGIELDAAKGDNNGTVKKRTYFKCDDKKGVFVSGTDIKVSASKTSTKKTTGSKKKAPPKKTTSVTKKPVKKTTGSKKKVPPKKKANGGKKKTTTTTSNNKNKGPSKPKKSPTPIKDQVKKKDSKPKKKRTSVSKKRNSKTVKPVVVYKVGDKVEIKPGKKGQIKFIGEAKNLGPGTWYGIRLTEKRGTCDGYSKGHEFFKCVDGYGIYVQIKLILNILKEDNDFDFMNEEEEINSKKQEYLDKVKENSDKLQAVHDKFKKIDEDNSYALDKEEFSEFAHELLGYDRRTARDLFDVVDVSGNGEVSFAEFENWLKNSGLVDKVVEESKKEEEPEKEETTNDDENKEEPKEEETTTEEPKEEETTTEEPKEEETTTEEPETTEENTEEPKEEENTEEPQEEEPKEDENTEEPTEEPNEEETTEENTEDPVEENTEEPNEEENKENTEETTEENTEEPKEEENTEEPKEEETTEEVTEDTENTEAPPEEENTEETTEETTENTEAPTEE